MEQTMRDRNALVTRDVTGESQHPVPSRPNPTPPALYIARGHLSSIASLSNARAATEPSDTHQPHATTTAWMRAAR